MNNKQNGVSRLLRLVWKEYKIEMLVVILAIIGSALASVKGTLFLQTLIDDYIVPLTESNYPDFAPLASALFKIAMIYILGILCSYIYNRIMVNVSQGTMKIIRTKLFNHQTIISGDGGSLSQGQRQLLAIARAAVANPPVLVLDEATSSIDTHTEELVQDGMDKLMAGRTTFVIAHRLSTIRNADCIMVLENGKIIERGNHEQLIKEKGRYYQLYTGDFELSY